MKTCDNCGGLYTEPSDYQQGETVSIAGKLCRCPIPLNIQKLNHGESPSQLDRIEDKLDRMISELHAAAWGTDLKLPGNEIEEDKQ